MEESGRDDEVSNLIATLGRSRRFGPSPYSEDHSTDNCAGAIGNEIAQPTMAVRRPLLQLDQYAHRDCGPYGQEQSMSGAPELHASHQEEHAEKKNVLVVRQRVQGQLETDQPLAVRAVQVKAGKPGNPEQPEEQKDRVSPPCSSQRENGENDPGQNAEYGEHFTIRITRSGRNKTGGCP